ncbi:MAG: hypothetical protein JWM32_3149 [Verrucomicrobia bacterium]|nr:hypothetical protein [Verrucomicrobiota bacterium]
MKFLRLIPVLLVAGSHSAPAASLPVPPTAAAVPAPTPSSIPVAPAPNPLEGKVRQQAQIIEALMSQNEALAARLAVPPPSPVPLPVAVAPATPVASAAITPVALPAPRETEVSPNAEGIVDLVTPAAAKPGEAVNPFLVRAVATEGVREISVHVTGIIHGPVLCAVVNGRIVQAGDTFESLGIERIESTAVLARAGGKLVRLTVTEKPIRIRVAL